MLVSGRIKAAQALFSIQDINLLQFVSSFYQSFGGGVSIRIPAHLWPATAGELYRIVHAIPRGIPALVVSIDPVSNVVTYVNLAAVKS